ncbi:MAG TPA: metalloregulator ArsR/SmtB family transcription factor [Thermoanaerobaculia bacterium]|nr:metalloregulator ArsR/SmtB family transcription factor [Thermoanaerobaculia bacterium]
MEAAAGFPPFLKLLADEQRWKLLEALAYSDRRVQELVRVLQQPQNLVSYHLRKLREHALVRERRSAADRRDVYYSLDLDRLKGMLMSTGEALHPGLGDEPDAHRDVPLTREGKRVRVLFLCTHNSARSQMAEAILRQMAEDRVEVASAGTEVTRVHPLAAKTMAARGIDSSGLRSKHLNEFLDQQFDYVITVCDRASETCPIFPGAPERIHWSIPDPSSVEGDDATREAAFQRAADDLLTRIRYLLSLLQRRQG